MSLLLNRIVYVSLSLFSFCFGLLDCCLVVFVIDEYIYIAFGSRMYLEGPIELERERERER